MSDDLVWLNFMDLEQYPGPTEVELGDIISGIGKWWEESVRNVKLALEPVRSAMFDTGKALLELDADSIAFAPVGSITILPAELGKPYILEPVVPSDLKFSTAPISKPSNHSSDLRADLSWDTDKPLPLLTEPITWEIVMPFQYSDIGSPSPEAAPGEDRDRPALPPRNTGPRPKHAYGRGGRKRY